MSLAPLLLVGGSGVAGTSAAKHLRAASPDTPLLIGGRDLDKAAATAAALGNAEGVALDLAADDLGLGDRPVGAVAVLVMNDTLSALRFAQAHRAPYISISWGPSEIGPEIATFMQRPDVAPVVLGAEWLVGAVTVPTLHFAADYRRLDAIAVGALLDEADTGGPAAVSDLERLSEVTAAALVRRDGAFVWQTGDDLKSRFRAVDGGEVEAAVFSAYDVMGLAAATGARDVTFRLATAGGAARRRDGAMPAEIVVDLAGEGHDGRPRRSRHAVTHPDGQMPLTGLGVAMVLERLVGLDGGHVPAPGLYFPYQIIEPAAYFARVEAIGGRVATLDPL